MSAHPASPEHPLSDPANEAPGPASSETDPAASESAAAPAPRAGRLPSPINIRNLSVRCGRCNQYQVLVGFSHLDEEWNLYTYECDGEPCVADPSSTRTFLEVPADLDEFANRDPNWRGGAKFGGA